jgi:O-antigen/teichoic acid export membrane protein
MNERVVYLRRAAGSGLLNSIASAACVALVLPAIIASIGFDAYGHWAIVGVFVGVASLLDLGMSKALVYLIPSDESAESELVSGAAVLCLGATLIAAALLLLLAWTGVPIFGPAVARAPGLTWWLALAGVVVLVCQVCTTLIRAVFEARCKAHVVNVGFAAYTLGYYGLAMLLAHFAMDVRIIIASSAGVFVLTLVVHLQLLWADRPLVWRRPDRALLQRISRVAMRTFAVDLPSIAYLPLLLSLFLAMAPQGGDFGSFDLATRITLLCSTALSTLAVPFYAMVAGARAAERPQVRALLDRFVPWMLLLALAGWLLFAWVGERLLHWWMPEAPPGLAASLRILLAGGLLHAALEPATRLLLGTGRTPWLMAVRLAMLGVGCSLLLLLNSLPLLQRFSIAGCAGWIMAAGLLALSLRSVRWGRAD